MKPNEKYDKAPELAELIAEFSEKAKKQKPIWNAKYVSINFEYKGEVYEISAEDMGVSDSQLECVQLEMAERLRQLGARHIQSDGFLD